MAQNHPREQSYMELLRALSGAWQRFERFAADDIRGTGLSAPQFDVICTLGDTSGMTFTELGERTLIYKTTLTGVVDRLEGKGLTERCPCEQDRRCVFVRLTDDGDVAYHQLFPAHVERVHGRLCELSPSELAEATRLLRRLRELL